ncbi:beta-lactamase family protein [Hymenobacter sp. BT18]|uniref:serine hydrolase domain-containing protein n=1 Tax=Hymenobacter sp. BT18 TaxID=2835648 RepID=UPI00143EE8DB|nr:serine hydrolase domain-containing protein [Hymenobacter sp. BT18]QIX60401.1 beta-lactamase family protein [Hymenobacter sp. BT18]
MRILLAAVLLFLSLTTTAQQQELATLLKREKVPGLQVVYSKNGKSTAYALGQRKSGTPQALTGKTTFQAASLGKVVLAYVALRLHDRGMLALDKPLLSYAPYPRLAVQPGVDKITARMVLTHSAGLPNWAENPLADSWKTSVLRLKYAPDSCWNYSGEGYVWLQKTLEHLTGKSWEALAQQEVFGPLKMRHSSYVWQPGFDKNASFGHDNTGKATEVRRFAEPNAGFSLLSTADDYSRFVQALLAGTGLQPATHQLLLRPASEANRCGRALTPTDAHIAWACGVGLVTTSRGPALWHWGDNGDFKNFFLAFPEQQETLVLFTNGANGQRLTNDVLQLFFRPGEYRALQWLAEE